ncbi:MAG TPA: hypothetical protein VGE02_16620, partial [Gemmatimonadales bacterium]
MPQAGGGTRERPPDDPEDPPLDGGGELGRSRGVLVGVLRVSGAGRLLGSRWACGAGRDVSRVRAASSRRSRS